MRICRGRWRGGTCGRGCDLLIHAAAAGTKPEAICTWRSRRSKTPPAERVGRTLPPAWWGTENTPAGSALAMASPENTNVSGSVDDRRNTTRWRSRLRTKGDRGSAEKCGVAASASKPANVHSLALAATRERRSGISGKMGRSGERQQADECKPASVHSLALAATRGRRSGIIGKIGRSGERQQADECKPANVHSLALAATGDRLSAVAKKWGVAASASKPAILLSEVDRRVRGWPWRRYSAHGVRRPQRRQIRIFSRGRFELSVDPTRLR